MSAAKSKLRALRKALALSSEDVGRLIGKSGGSVRYLEKAEIDGSATLSNLAQIAQALGHELVIELRPKVSVKDQLEAKAREQAREIVSRVATTMGLEQQELSAQDIAKLEESTFQQLLAKPKLLQK